ncbi:yojK [Symbiodinium sp. CCMP2456]|nr:yojK [Symbiodinium sp. CCMP2456]
MASGHINPSLPVARTLVEEGQEVHYLCREQMKDAIEDTGATFHSEIEELPEMYEGRNVDIFGCLSDLQKEYGLEEDPLFVAMFKIREIMQEMMLPGILRWLEKVGVDVVVLCPLMNKEACWAAQILGIPCVGIMTTAGPGSLRLATLEWLEKMGYTTERCLKESCAKRLQVRLERRAYQPLLEAVDRLRAKYGLEIELDEEMAPVGMSVVAKQSALTLVTTVDFLADPLSPELEKIYEEAQTEFVFVGPLLDKAGAKRAAGHKFQKEAGKEAESTKGLEPPQSAETAPIDPVALMRKAREAGRKVIFASMGTVITGDSPEVGWANHMSVDGVFQGLTGKELCQAAWGGLFDAFGTDSADEGPLLLVSLGPQPDALENLVAPANAACLPVMPQVDILKEGVDLFLTHGGQNSFMESLSTGTPVVVCPGFADQPVNAQKAVQLGVGLQIERPMCDLSEASQVAAKYRRDVAAAVQEVHRNPEFKTKANECSLKMQSAGGVRRATDLILQVANSGCFFRLHDPHASEEKVLGQDDFEWCCTGGRNNMKYSGTGVDGSGLTHRKALQSKASLKLIQAQVAAGHDMKGLGVRMEQSEFKASALDGAATVTFDGMQNLRSVDISDEALAKAGSETALAEALLKALQEGHDSSVAGSEDDVWSLYQNNPDLIQAPLIQIGAGNTAQDLWANVTKTNETLKLAEELFLHFDQDEDGFWNFKETSAVQLATEGTEMGEEAFNSLIIAAAPNGGRHLTEEDMARGLSKDQVLDLYTNAQRQRQLGFVLDIMKDHQRVFSQESNAEETESKPAPVSVSVD